MPRDSIGQRDLKNPSLFFFSFFNFFLYVHRAWEMKAGLTGRSAIFGGGFACVLGLVAVND